MLLHQNALLLEHLTLQDLEIRRLGHRCALLENGDEYRKTFGGIHETKSLAPAIPSPEVKSEVLRHLSKLGSDNGNAVVLSDLEIRLGKVG